MFSAEDREVIETIFKTMKFPHEGKLEDQLQWIHDHRKLLVEVKRVPAGKTTILMPSMSPQNHALVAILHEKIGEEGITKLQTEDRFKSRLSDLLYMLPLTKVLTSQSSSQSSYAGMREVLTTSQQEELEKKKEAEYEDTRRAFKESFKTLMSGIELDEGDTALSELFEHLWEAMDENGFTNFFEQNIGQRVETLEVFAGKAEIEFLIPQSFRQQNRKLCSEFIKRALGNNPDRIKQLEGTHMYQSLISHSELQPPQQRSITTHSPDAVDSSAVSYKSVKK